MAEKPITSRPSVPFPFFPLLFVSVFWRFALGARSAPLSVCIRMHDRACCCGDLGSIFDPFSRVVDRSRFHHRPCRGRLRRQSPQRSRPDVEKTPDRQQGPPRGRSIPEVRPRTARKKNTQGRSIPPFRVREREARRARCTICRILLSIWPRGMSATLLPGPTARWSLPVDSRPDSAHRGAIWLSGAVSNDGAVRCSRATDRRRRRRLQWSFRWARSPPSWGPRALARRRSCGWLRGALSEPG